MERIGDKVWDGLRRRCVSKVLNRSRDADCVSGDFKTRIWDRVSQVSFGVGAGEDWGL